MSIIHTYLSPAEVRRLSQRDNGYLRQRMADNSALDNLLHKTPNKAVLAELQCILDSKPITRRKTEQHSRDSRVSVYKDGKLIRIEHTNGKVMKLVEMEK